MKNGEIESFSETKIKEIKGVELFSKKAKKFFECKGCIKKLMESGSREYLTPREYGMYEASLYPFVYPSGEKTEIVVIWCKRCKSVVWDSRFLVSMF